MVTKRNSPFNFGKVMSSFSWSNIKRRSKPLMYTIAAVAVVLINAALAPSLFLSTSPNYFPHSKNVVSSVLKNSIASTAYQTVLDRGIFVSIPMVLDIILDARYAFSGSGSGKQERVHWFVRAILLLSLSFAPYLGRQFSMTDDNLVLIYVSESIFQAVATLGCILAFVSYVERKSVFIGRISVVILLFLTLAEYLWGVSILYEKNALLQATFGASYFFSYALLAYLCLTLYRSSKGTKMTPNGMCLAVYLTAYWTYSLITWIVSAVYNKGVVQNSPTDCLSCYTYLDIALMTIVMVVPGRVARLQSTIMAEALEGRQAFVRYVSHEIRTPLNSMLVGLTYMRDELSVAISTAETEKDQKAATSIASSEMSAQNVQSQQGELSLKVVQNRQGESPQKGNGNGQQGDLSSGLLCPMVETVDIMMGSCQSAISILNDLLLYDKIEAGMMSLELVDTQVINFVYSSMKPFQLQANEKNLRLDFKCSDYSRGVMRGKVVRIDNHKISQVFRNLISNALKFTPPSGNIVVSVDLIRGVFNRGGGGGGGDHSNTNDDNGGASMASSLAGDGRGRSSVRSIASIASVASNTANGLLHQIRIRGNRGSGASEVSSRLGGGQRIKDYYVRIDVKDSGAGISPENQKKLFGQYVQFNAGKLQKGEGSGLGLWISKGIVELHGGRIGAHSEGEGKGTTFYIELPLFTPASENNSLSRRIGSTVRQVVSMGRGNGGGGGGGIGSTRREMPLASGGTASRRSSGAAGIVSRQQQERMILSGGGSSSSSPSATGWLRSRILGGKQSAIVPGDAGTRTHGGGRSRQMGLRSIRPASSNQSTTLVVPAGAGGSGPQAPSLYRTSYRTNRDSVLTSPRLAQNNSHARLPPLQHLKAVPESLDLANSNGNSNSMRRRASAGGNSSISMRRRLSAGGNSSSSNASSAAPISKSNPLFKLMNSGASSMDGASRRRGNDQGQSSARIQIQGSERFQLEEERGTITTGGTHGVTVSGAVGSVAAALFNAVGGGDDDSFIVPSLSHTDVDDPMDPPIVPRSTIAVAAMTAQSHALQLAENLMGSPKALSLCILIVDDSLANRKVTKRLLNTHGYSVLEAVDGLDCLRVVKDSQERREVIDLILMDNNMPNMGGMEATKTLRDINYTGAIFGLTGDVDEVDMAQFMNSGATDVLPKPLQMSVLKAKLGVMFYGDGAGVRSSNTSVNS